MPQKCNLSYGYYKDLITGTFNRVREVEGLLGNGPWAQRWGRVIVDSQGEEREQSRCAEACHRRKRDGHQGLSGQCEEQ